MDRELSNITINDATLMFRNFSGREKTDKGRVINKEGDRNFCVIIDEELASVLAADGWNIKHLKPKREDDVPAPYIPVAVNFAYRFPPKIHMRTSSSDILLDEDTVTNLDFAEIKHVDLVIRPRPWETATGSGVKAYLRTMIVDIFEDELEAQYSQCEGHCECCGEHCGGNCHCH